ncbi:Nn.00g007820.m01.CDS01 [Neocucurbitaria sp. VM-36]
MLLHGFSAIAGLLVFTGPAYAADCTREGLLAAAESYLAAQTSGKISDLKLSSTNFTYQQNNKISEIAKGILSTPYKIDLNRSTADTVACASYTMWISSSGSKPYVVSTQIRHANNDTNSISMINTVAATTGDLFFDAKKTLGYIQKEDWTIIPAAQRPSRELLKQVGDAYLDMWTDAKAADSIPWGTECERVEGSSYTNPCGKTLPRGGSSKNNGMRRYVIDEEMGSVDVLYQFDSLGAWPDSHEIRVVAGKVKYVHTVTVMKVG